MSTAGDVQYVGIHDSCGGYHEYIRKCSVLWWDIMGTLGFMWGAN